MKNKLIRDWGINDVEYNVHKTGMIKNKHKKVWVCPYYTDWCSILERVYSKVYQNKYPTYSGCTIDPEWKYLSNFIKWVDSQPNRDWQNCEPDKDFLSESNKHYGPDTVVYIPKRLNLFILSRGKSRGDLMIGVSRSGSNKNPYRVHCCNPITNKRERLGCFSSEIEAHKAWQAKKHDIACLLAEQQQDPRVADALRQRYAPDKDWTSK